MKTIMWIVCLACMCGLVDEQRMDSAEFLASLNVTSGDRAKFRCPVNPNATDIDWLINEITFIQNSNPDISVDDDKSTLTIVAREGYSGTTVRCVNVYLDGSHNLSNLAVLLVQGALDSVADLTATRSESAISLTWTPPFSLNLSYFDVDILYRVKVCRLNGGEAFNYSSEVVDQPEYSFPARAGDSFQVTVTPLSRRQNGRDLKGRSKVLNVTFPVAVITETAEPPGGSTQTTTTAEPTTTVMKTDDDKTLGLGLGVTVLVIVILLVFVIVVTRICYKKRAGSEASCMALTVKKDRSDSPSTEHAESVVETALNEGSTCTVVLGEGRDSSGRNADTDPAASRDEEKDMSSTECKKVMNNDAASEIPNAKMKPPPKSPPKHKPSRSLDEMSPKPKVNTHLEYGPAYFAGYVERNPLSNGPEVNLQKEDNL